MRTALSILIVFLGLSAALSAQEIAISFDDAPLGAGPFFSGQERTDSLIAVLDRMQVEQAVFFVVGERLGPEMPARTRRIRQYAEAGHVIANHSHSHRRPSDHGVQWYVEDMLRAHGAIKDFVTFRRWYRFPFLDEGRTEPVRDSLRAALDSLDYFNGYVTVDNYDWYLDRLAERMVESGESVDTQALGEIYVQLLWEGIQLYDRLGREALGRSPKHMLLLHENDLAALFLDDLIVKLRSEGWKIITAEEAYADPIAQVTPNVVMNNQGRVAAIARERGVPGPWGHRSEDVAWLDSLFVARGFIAGD